MRAARLHGFGDVRIDNIDDPVCGPHDVIIDVRCVQVSVTECMLINGDDVAMHEQLAERVSREPVQFGGHEFSGVITEIGAEVSRLAVGQRVTAVETLPCGHCSACERGRNSSCIRPAVIAFSRPGALAERISVPASAVVPLPEGVSYSAAAAVQPLAGAVHAHAVLAVQPGETMLILGGGVMGLLGAAVARHGNTGTIMLTSHSPAKLELGAKFGADRLVNAADDVLAAALEATDGVGFDVVLETAGGNPDVGLSGTETLDLAVRAVRRGGRIAVVSVLPARAEFPAGLMREKSLTLHHPRSGAGYYAQTTSVFEHSLGLIKRGSVDVGALITHHLDGIDEIPTAIEITSDKGRFGAINPAQVHLQ